MPDGNQEIQPVWITRTDEGRLIYQLSLSERTAKLVLFLPLQPNWQSRPLRPPEPIPDHDDLLKAAGQFLDKFLYPIAADESKDGRDGRLQPNSF